MKALRLILIAIALPALSACYKSESLLAPGQLQTRFVSPSEHGYALLDKPDNIAYYINFKDVQSNEIGVYGVENNESAAKLGDYKIYTIRKGENGNIFALVRKTETGYMYIPIRLLGNKLFIYVDSDMDSYTNWPELRTDLLDLVRRTETEPHELRESTAGLKRAVLQSAKASEDLHAKPSNRLIDRVELQDSYYVAGTFSDELVYIIDIDKPNNRVKVLSSKSGHTSWVSADALITPQQAKMNDIGRGAVLIGGMLCLLSDNCR